MSRQRLIHGVVVVLFAASGLSAADWPMWRYDAARSGYCPAGLPDTLHLQWQRDLPAVTPAWPKEPRMLFDACYEPIVVGNALVVGSPNDGSVTAYDTESGAVHWRRYTNGPVRFAPVGWQGRVYVASDDGRVYCLDAVTGETKWTFRAAPADRPDLRHLGNGRLLSFWPVRGGPVLGDDTLYVGSGVWPILGAFVYALDLATGAVKWCNDRLNRLADIRTDHNRIADSALCPQGYMVLSGGKLLAANGRSMPVGLDPGSGKLLHYVQGYRNGHCRVTARGKWVFVGTSGVLHAESGREVGGRWHEGLPDTPAEYGTRIDLFEALFIGYKFIPACDAWSVLAPTGACGGHDGTFFAYDLSGARKATYNKKRGDQELEPAKWEAPLLWKLATRYAADKPASKTIIQAGNRIYGHAGRVLLAIDPSGQSGKPEVAWEEELPGTPGTMLAADDRLFVVTEEGHLLCFGAAPQKPVIHPAPNVPLPRQGDMWRQRAERILEATSTSSGYCVLLGLERGELMSALLHDTELTIIAVEADGDKVNAIRESSAAAGLPGDRVQVVQADPSTIEMPPYLASLIISERYSALQLLERMSAAKLVRMLRPYGGVACLELPESGDAFRRWAESVQPEQAVLSSNGGLALLRRVGPLPGSADWTHESASAARTYFSKDKLVKAPLGVLWYGDGPRQGFKKHKDYHVGVKPQVVDGRLFAFDEREKYLQAYDVYTGRTLWRTNVDEFTRFASMSDGIYTGQGNACVIYATATGAELHRFPYRGGEAGAKLFVADLRVVGDVIVVAVDHQKVRSIADGLYDSKALIALDRKTGAQLWTRTAEDRFSHHGLALGGGLLYCVDSPSAKTTGALQRRGDPPATLDSTLYALHPRTGEVKWRKVLANPFISYEHTSYPAGSVQSEDDALFYSEECDVLIVYRYRRYRAVKGRTGETLWEREQGASQPIMVAGKIFYNGGGGAFDVKTGEHIPGNSRMQGGHGCNHPIACEHLFFRRRFTAAYFDIATGKATYLLNARSGCTNSLIPACGVLSSPCFSVGCVCNHPLETSFCLVHMPGIEGWLGKEPGREPMPLGERDPTKWRALVAPAEQL